jgi:ubiquinone/menaquinone biosynthesis C-methylase UbiE
VMKHLNGWLKARAAEKNFWSQKDVKAIKTAAAWENFVKKHFGFPFGYFSFKNVLEVGCGPYGLVHFIDSNVCIGIDPILFDTWNGTDKVNSSTLHIVATGEFLPFRDNSFDVCVCFNVLDHSIFPRDVLREIVRILKPNGELLLWVHTLRSVLRIFSPFLNLIDTSHPHHFTFHRVLHLLKENGLIATSTLTTELETGNFVQRFVKSFLYSFKLAVASFMMFNLFVLGCVTNKT